MKKSQEIKRQIFSRLFLMTLCFSISVSLSAQGEDYHIRLKTANERHAGCDNDIRLEIIGENGSTGKFWVTDSHKVRNGTDDFSITGKPDVGKISEIKVEIKKVLADNWKCEYIYVTKGETAHNENSEDGYYEFIINRWFGGERLGGRMSEEVSIYPTYSNHPRISVSPVGGIEINKHFYTKVDYGYNPADVEQEMMKSTETWSFVNTISMSKTNETSTNVALTVSYDSPETIYGSFGAEASAGWEESISETKEASEEYFRSSTFNWSYNCPANSFLFRKLVFEIPYGYQVYSDGTNERIVRKLNSMIIPAGVDLTLPIPYTEKEGDNEILIPVEWSVIENEWLRYMDDFKRDLIIQNPDFRKRWIEKGWVTTIGGPNKFYTIQQKNNNRFLDAHEQHDNDFSAVTRTSQNNDSQKWIILPLGNDTYTIQQKSNNRFLDAHEQQHNDFSVVTRTSQNNDSQKWIILPLGNDTYTIQQKSNNRFLDAHEQQDNDFSVVTRTSQQNDSQKWIITLQ